MVTNGIIAWCDILGYKAFMKNTAPDDSAAEKVLSALAEVPQKAKEYTNRWLPHVAGFPEAIDTITHDVLSDTIVTIIDLPDADDYNQRIVRWISLCTYVSALEMMMMGHGLPIRGCISCGLYKRQNGYLASPAMVEAHTCTESIDLSAVCMTADSYGELIRHVSTQDNPLVNDWISKWFLKYKIPLRNGGKSYSWLLKPTETYGMATPSRIPDSRNKILRFFTDHNKGLDASGHDKYENTLKWYEHADAHNPEAP